MRLLYNGPEGAREVSITDGPVASVGELAEILGLPPPVAGLWVNEQWAAADCRLDEAGVTAGSYVGVRPGPGPDQPGLTFEVVGGLCAGDRTPVLEGGLSLGRSPEADVTLPGVGLRPHHARMDCADGKVVAQIVGGEPIAVEMSTPLRLGGALIQVSVAPDDRPNRMSSALGGTASGPSCAPRSHTGAGRETSAIAACRSFWLGRAGGASVGRCADGCALSPLYGPVRPAQSVDDGGDLV